MPTFTNTWFQRAIPFWKSLFDQLGWTDGRPLTAVEIGSFEGQSTLWMLENLLTHTDSRIHCIDTFAGGIEHSREETLSLRERFDANVGEARSRATVEILQGLSRHGLQKLIQRNIQADVVYVDGSHQAADVLEDLVLAFRVLKVGGIMICDDYLWFMERHGGEDLSNSPKPAIDAFVNCYIRKLRVLHNQPLYQLALQKSAD